MTALSAAVQRRYIGERRQSAGPVLVTEDEIIYHGALVVVDATSGLAEAATAATGKIVIGVADLEWWHDKAPTGQAPSLSGTHPNVIDATGDATRQVLCARGVVGPFANKGGDTVSVGDTAYVEDDATVRATGTGSIAVGKVIRVDTDGVFVEIF